MRTPRLLALATLLAACAWSAAAEPVFQQQGALDAGDSELPDGRLVDWHKVQLTAGNRYLFGAQSGELDTALLVRFSDGVVLSNNDFYGSDPGLVYTAVRSEAVDVGVANALDPEHGSYEVSVEKVSPSRPVQAGQKVSRAVAADSAGARGWRSDSLMLMGGKGDRVALKARSSSFDPALRVQSRMGYWDESDDSGSATDAALAFVFLQQGQVEIVVRAADPTGGGSYELEIARQTATRTLRMDTRLQARMQADADLYLLEAKRGSAALVTVESDDFDPVLTLVDRLGRKAHNDDSQGETTARLLHVFTDDEPVAVAVRRSGEGDPGAYTISVRPSDFEAGEYATTDLAELAAGDVVRGRLGPTDMNRRNRYIHRYSFTAEANQVLRLELTSEDFDAWLEVSGPDGFAVSDDDGLGGYNALVNAVGRGPGVYVVRVSSAGDWETGLYELAFASTGVVEPLLETEGRLERRDQRDIGGRYFDTYAFDVEEGQSLTVEMTSAELDSFLYVWDPQGEEVHSDDDGGGETNARVSVQGAAAGKWTVYATSSATGETGAYALRVLTY